VKRITKFALFGAVGFCIGGIFPGLAMFLAFAFTFERGESWYIWVIAFVILVAGFFAKGSIGGKALKLALSKSQQSISPLALYGAIGFIIGGLLRFFLPPIFSGVGGLWYPVISFNTFLLDGLEGAIGGAALGLAFGDKRKVMGLALAGFLGFGISWMIANYLGYRFEWLPQTIIRFTLSGIIGGALLGVALGYFERE
jgi:hypothetical protein